MAEKKNYYIEGNFNIRGGSEVLLENYFSKAERHIHAYSIKQATKLFALQFEKILAEKSYRNGVRVYIGDALITEVEDEEEKPIEKMEKEIKEQKKTENRQMSIDDLL